MDREPLSVLVTGCSTGIGRATADLLRSRGYRVIATARKEEDLADLVREGFEVVQLELRESKSVQLATGKVLEITNGRLYGLFNNAAYGQAGAVEDLSRDTLREQLEVNLLGTHELTVSLLPSMRKCGEGRIINCSSVLGLVTLRYRGAYSASKYALEALSDALRMELIGSGIYVSLIEPGPIESSFRSTCQQKFSERIDLATSAHGDKYQQMIAELAHPRASQYFTLPPTAVAEKVLAALRAKHPAPRYYVTLPTHVLGFARRLLPTSLLDWLLLKTGA